MENITMISGWMYANSKDTDLQTNVVTTNTRNGLNLDIPTSGTSLVKVGSALFQVLFVGGREKHFVM